MAVCNCSLAGTSACKTCSSNPYCDNALSIIKPDVPIYDICERHENCTVEVWRNSVTGQISVGWYENGGEDENIGQD